tara:strand:- start:17900 stop:19234 length:1335 start_codon:yes stop_codon:yes gene_type:complete
MAIYGHNFDMFVGKFFNTASKTVADLTAALTEESEFAIELEDTGLLATTTALTTGDVFRVVQLNTDGSLHASPYIKFDNIRKGSVQEDGVSADTDFIAENEQVSNIGYGVQNTSHSIEAINSNRYTIRLNFTNDTELYSEQKDQYFFEYVSDASATQIEIADYFAQKMSKMQYLADGSTQGASRARIAVLRQSSVSKVATAGDITFTRGSKIATLENADFSGLAAGVYIGVGVDDLGLAASSVFYKIVKISGNNTANGYIELDQPYQGISETVGEGTSNSTVGYVTAANMASATCGLTIVGLDQFHKVGLYPYHKVIFDITLDGWGSTGSATTETAAKGNTVGEAIADLEWFSLSKNSPGSGTWTGNGFPSVESYAELKAVDSDTYDVISMDYVLVGNDSNSISAGGPIKGTLVMACKAGEDNLQDHLNDLFVNVDGIADVISV